MEFSVYSHQTSSVSDESLAFYSTLEQSRFGASVFRDLHLRLDSSGRFEGPLTIFEVRIRMPDVSMMIDLLNAPNRILEFCLISKERVESTNN